MYESGLLKFQDSTSWFCGFSGAELYASKFIHKILGYSSRLLFYAEPNALVLLDVDLHSSNISKSTANQILWFFYLFFKFLDDTRSK